MPVPSNTLFTDGGPSVTGDNLNTFIQNVADVDSLRAFIGTAGMLIYMQGFSSVGDFGQGYFWWNPNGTGPDDGGITNVIPYGVVVGCWTRLAANSPAVSFTADLTGDQTLPVDGTAATVVFNNFEFNNGGGYNTATGIYTPPAKGLYLLSASVYFSGTTPAGTATSVAVYRNGSPSRAEASPLMPSVGSPSTFGSVGVTALFQMNGTTDTLQVKASGAGFTTLKATGGATASFISAAWIAPTA